MQIRSKNLLSTSEQPTPSNQIITLDQFPQQAKLKYFNRLKHGSGTNPKLLLTKAPFKEGYAYKIMLREATIEKLQTVANKFLGRNLITKIGTHNYISLEDYMAWNNLPDAVLLAENTTGKMRAIIFEPSSLGADWYEFKTDKGLKHGFNVAGQTRIVFDDQLHHDGTSEAKLPKTLSLHGKPCKKVFSTETRIVVDAAVGRTWNQIVNDFPEIPFYYCLYQRQDGISAVEHVKALPQILNPKEAWQRLMKAEEQAALESSQVTTAVVVEEASSTLTTVEFPAATSAVEIATASHSASVLTASGSPSLFAPRPLLGIALRAHNIDIDPTHLNKLSLSMQNYLRSLHGQPKASELLCNRNLLGIDKKDFCDALTGQIVDIPVKLHDKLYDFSTLVAILEGKLENSIGDFTFTDIKVASSTFTAMKALSASNPLIHDNNHLEGVNLNQFEAPVRSYLHSLINKPKATANIRTLNLTAEELELCKDAATGAWLEMPVKLFGKTYNVRTLVDMLEGRMHNTIGSFTYRDIQVGASSIALIKEIETRYQQASHSRFVR